MRHDGANLSTQVQIEFHCLVNAVVEELTASVQQRSRSRSFDRNQITIIRQALCKSEDHLAVRVSETDEAAWDRDFIPFTKAIVESATDNLNARKTVRIQSNTRGELKLQLTCSLRQQVSVANERSEVGADRHQFRTGQQRPNFQILDSV